jgi:hypothetical protein
MRVMQKNHFYNKDGLPSPARATRASLGTRQTSAGVVALYAQQAPPQVKPSQLVKSADADANVLGLIVAIGNSKCCTDNTRGFLNWARITKQLASPSDYEKTELSLVPGYPSLLQIEYPSVSTALTKDFKLIEAQMEVDIADANDLIQRYVSNLQEKIIAQEASLAKSENVTKSKFICLPIDPSKGKNHTCHNGNWQGAT